LGRLIGNDGVYQLVRKRYLIFLTVDGRRVPVIRVPCIAHVRTHDILFEYKWSGANLIFPLSSAPWGSLHFRCRYYGAVFITKAIKPSSIEFGEVKSTGVLIYGISDPLILD